MQTITRQVIGRVSTIGPRSFQAIAATDKLCSDGFALRMPEGADISRLNSGRANLLFSHDAIIGKIVRAWFEPHQLMFEGEFAPQGVSQLADDQCRLLKASILNSCSLCFDVNEKRKISGGFIATKWEALEVSLCAVPIDSGAYVTKRAHRAGKVLNSANVEALQNAHAAAGMAQHHIESVLSNAGIEPDSADAIEGDRAYRRRQAEAARLRWSPVELEELQKAAAAREDARRAPYDYAARQRDAARVRKGGR